MTEKGGISKVTPMWTTVVKGADPFVFPPSLPHIEVLTVPAPRSLTEELHLPQSLGAAAPTMDALNLPVPLPTQGICYP